MAVSRPMSNAWMAIGKTRATMFFSHMQSGKPGKKRTKVKVPLTHPRDAEAVEVVVVAEAVAVAKVVEEEMAIVNENLTRPRFGVTIVKTMGTLHPNAGLRRRMREYTSQR